MDFVSETRSADGVLERRFLLGDAPGILWTGPGGPGPLVLLGHPGGLDRMHPRLAARARDAVAAGFVAATLELPGSGGRRPLPDVDAARAELQRAVRAGEPVPEDVVERLVVPLVDATVPELQRLADALTALPEVSTPIGYSGGVTAIGVRLAAVEPRVAAVLLFAGSYVPRSMFAQARSADVPMLMLLQWDDAGNDRRLALDLFDAWGAAEKTLHANTGGHTGVPAHEGPAVVSFFERHLGQKRPA